jgi:hypothetical protein
MAGMKDSSLERPAGPAKQFSIGSLLEALSATSKYKIRLFSYL